MEITKEMYKKVDEHFASITPEELYKDLVENYRLEPGTDNNGQST